MRPGPLEIVIIIVVILLIAVVMRIIRVGQDTAEKSKKPSVEIPKRQVEERAGKVRHHLKLVGTVFILIGIVLLLSGIRLFQWVFWSYLLAFINITIGFGVVFLSRKR